MRRAPIHLMVVVWILLVTGPAAAEREALWSLGPVGIQGPDADTLTLGVGTFDFADQGSSAAGTIEYRSGRKLSCVGPAMGLVANTDGGVLGYFGIYADFSYGDIDLTPVLSIGGYHRGDGRDLGGAFQFRASGDLAYRFENGNRIGLRLAHVSNANTHSPNPGQEELFVIYSVAFGPLF